MEKLLLIDNEADVQYSFRRLFASAELVIHTASSGEEGLKVFAQVRPDIVVSDVRMEGMTGLETLRHLRQLDAKVPVILMTAWGTTQMAIEAMKFGAFDYILKPFDIPKLKALIGSALKAARDMREAVTLQPTLSREDYEVGVVGRSEAMQSVFKLIGQLAGSDATALITGESGTGKELVAKAIYHHSCRSAKPFLAINCAALAENLLESELFGHEKGAFTGANTQRIGKFEQCHQGTLFLDEIGDMSAATQTRILRVLQSGTFERVGGNQTVTVDVRVIAATNKLLEKAVDDNQFRQDLFYRLNVVRLELPPLRDRKEDVRLLVDYFLRKLVVSGPPKAVGSDTLAILEAYQWPGNVRELENVIRRALVVSKGPALLPADLPPEVLGKIVRSSTAKTEQWVPVAPIGTGEGVAPLVTLAREMFRQARADPKLKLIPVVERVLVIEALRETQGNQVHAAKLLGITRATLRKRIEKFEIRRELNIE
ncbi:MAG: sigma-54-dependent Fis family transcriptional regulator [Pedosphaera sp.]|nr:sigma-54-dependent Fis family transcriptional regulator [Pedosphaera sp.]